ncbi:MAG: methyltransferase domain-containing protein [Candidatus Omnitrophica bacterium]|nr:methyltransferase domain-containing protein [Candidatus Omnitrophota bacterium]
MDKDLITRNFSRNAPHYDRHSGIQAGCARRLMELIRGERFHRVLEIGCGTGIYTRLLREEYPDAEITAVDISEAMVNTAGEKLRGMGLRLMVADGEHLPLGRGFDLITSNASFQWFEDPDAGIRRFSRALSPERGVMCFSQYGPETFTEFENILSESLGKEQWLSSRGFITGDMLKDIMERYFDILDFREEHFEASFTSLLDFLRDMNRSGARGRGLNGKARLGKRLIEDLERTYLDRFGGIIATHHVYFCKARRAGGAHG